MCILIQRIITCVFMLMCMAGYCAITMTYYVDGSDNNIMSLATFMVTLPFIILFIAFIAVMVCDDKYFGDF